MRLTGTHQGCSLGFAAPAAVISSLAPAPVARRAIQPLFFINTEPGASWEVQAGPLSARGQLHPGLADQRCPSEGRGGSAFLWEPERSLPTSKAWLGPCHRAGTSMKYCQGEGANELGSELSGSQQSIVL